MTRYGYFGPCRLCERDACTEHHVTPVEMEARGYPYEGVVPLCRICHDFLHEDNPNELLAMGGPEYLTEWLRAARHRLADYIEERLAKASRRKGGTNYSLPAPRWRKKQQRKIERAIAKSRETHRSSMGIVA